MNEFNNIQNEAIGALALYTFVKSYYTKTGRNNGPQFGFIFPLLPIVFNEECNTNLNKIRRYTKQRYFTLLIENPGFPVGLQKRMEDMADLTINSFNVALNKKILLYNTETTEIRPSPRVSFSAIKYEDNVKIIHSADLLGRWFADYKTENIFASLNLTL
jgi:hypothetical protein